MSKVYTIKELRQILKIGRNKAYELINTNQIKSIRVDKQIRIPEGYLNEFLYKEDESCVEGRCHNDTQKEDSNLCRKS